MLLNIGAFRTATPAAASAPLAIVLPRFLHMFSCFCAVIQSMFSANSGPGLNDPFPALTLKPAALDLLGGSVHYGNGAL